MGIGVGIIVQEEKGVHIVKLDGRLDASTTPIVEKKLAGLLEVSTRIAIDFTNVGYLSSAGMRLLLALTKKMDAKKGQAVFFGMEEDVFEIIKMAGFERILKIYKTKNEALKAFK